MEQYGMPMATALLALLAVSPVLVVALARWKRLGEVVSVLAVAISLGLAIALLYTVLGTQTPVGGTLLSVPLIGASLTLRVDALSALLAVVVLTLGLLAVVYSIRYVRRAAPNQLLGYYVPFLFFLMGMCGVLYVSDFLFFLVAWEFMSLPAYALIIFEREKSENLRAGLKYFVLSHIGNACMFIGVLILYAHGGSFQFEVIRAALASLLTEQPWLAHTAVLLIAFGFITKAGLFPSGDWLPDAHPAAPSPVSALLSGVMIKMGAYGLLRLFFWLLVPAGASVLALNVWGVILALWGTVSIIVGSAAALNQHDSKVLLAYSSISQSGYIVLGLGVALAFSSQLPLLAALALTGALVHIVADAAHKGLLFFTAGSALHATGSRDMRRLGGLHERMPVTTTTALVGALSLAGLPFMGAFVSKWLVVQAALFAGLKSPVLLICALAALFGSVMGLAYSLKFVAGSFLGPPAEPSEVEEAQEVPWSMRLPQELLALGCLLLGLFPWVLIRLVMTALPEPIAATAPQAFGGSRLLSVVTLSPQGPLQGLYAPLPLFGLFLILALVVWRISRAGAAPVRQVEGWQCGASLPPEQVRANPASYYWIFAKWMAPLYPRVALPEIKFPRETPLLLDTDRWLFRPIGEWGNNLGRRLSRLHTGLPHRYLLWQLLGAAILLGVVWLLQ